MEETAAALTRILGQVTQSNGTVGEIATSAEEQASGLAQDTAELERLTTRFNAGVEKRRNNQSSRKYCVPR